MNFTNRCMKILHYGTLDTQAGGPAMSTYLTLKGLRDAGVEAQIAMYPLSKNGRLRGNSVPVHVLKAPMDGKFLYSSSLKRELDNLGEFDIYHAQGVWQYPTYALVDVASKRGKPYLITPRGMLYPQDIAKSNTFFKKLSLKWRLLADLNHAACVHVTCKDEMTFCRDLGITAPIAIIPNPIEIKDYFYKKEDNVRRIGYLGRLSPRKNVEGLIHAFAELGDVAKSAELLIIGGGDRQYEAFLRAEAERLNLKNVVFTGFLNGKDKDKALASCSVLAMPSEFENLGNVILEGLVRGIPCIATMGSPWEELNTKKCGWWVPFRQDAITNAVSFALNVTDEELHIKGQNGRQLMEKNYSVTAIANKMYSVYGWILGKNNRPPFVYTI